MEKIVGKKLGLSSKSFVILPDNIKGVLVFIDKNQFDDASIKEFTFSEVEFKDDKKSIELTLVEGFVVASKDNFKAELKDYVAYIAADKNVTKVSREDLLKFFATQAEEIKKSEETPKNKEKKTEPEKNEKTNPIVYGVVILVALFAWLLYLNSTKADKDDVKTALATKVDKSIYDAKMKAVDGTLENQAKIAKEHAKQIAANKKANEINAKQIAANKKAISIVNKKILKTKKDFAKDLSKVNNIYDEKIQKLVKNQNVLVAEHCKPTFFFFNKESCQDYLAIKQLEKSKLDSEILKLENQKKREIQAIEKKYSKLLESLDKEKKVYQVKVI